MSITKTGVVRGGVIALDDDAGLTEGQRVEVSVRPMISPEERAARLAALEGSLAHLPDEAWDELDAIIAENRGYNRRNGSSDAG